MNPLAFRGQQGYDVCRRPQPTACLGALPRGRMGRAGPHRFSGRKIAILIVIG
jgi:hypothetical protein